MDITFFNRAKSDREYKAKKLNGETRRWLYDVLEFRSQVGSLSDGLPQMVKELRNTNARGEKRADLLHEINVKSLRAGKYFSSALQGIVPEDEYLLITAAEMGGKLSDGLNKARERMESKLKMQTAIFKTLSSFFIYLGLLIALLALFGNGLFPTLERITPVEKWPGFSQDIYSVIKAMPVWFPTLVSVIVIIFFIVKKSLTQWLNTDARKWCMDHIPPWSIHRDVTGQAVLESLASLSDVYSEREAILALRKSSSSSNLWINECYEMMKIRMDSGDGNPMLNNPLINQDIQSVLSAVGTSGDKRAFYIRAAERISQKVQKQLEKVNQTIGFISLLLIAVSLGLLIASYFLVALTSLQTSF